MMRVDTGWLALALLTAALLPLAPGMSRPADVEASQQGQMGPDVYEPDDTPEQANPLLPVGIPQQRTFASADDVDWVYIDLDAGQRVEGQTTGPCEIFMTLYAPDAQTPLANDDASSPDGNAHILFSAPRDGTYFVKVWPLGRSESPCGPYGLVANLRSPPPPDVFEPDDTPEQAKALPTDGTVQNRSTHAPGDVDWVTITVQANTAFRIGTTGSCDTVLTLFAPDAKTQLAEDDDSGPGSNALIVYTFSQAGTYYARVRLYDAEVAVCDSYGLSAVPTTPAFPDVYEPDDTQANAHPIALDGTPQERSIYRPQDMDWVSLSLGAGNRVLIWTNGPCDTYLSLVAPNGRTVLREDDDSGEDLNAAIFFPVKEAGMYYAVVRLFGAAEICPSYQLQALLLPPAHPIPAASPLPSVTATPRGLIAPTVTRAPATMGLTPTPLVPPATPSATRVAK